MGLYVCCALCHREELGEPRTIVAQWAAGPGSQRNLGSAGGKSPTRGSGPSIRSTLAPSCHPIGNPITDGHPGMKITIRGISFPIRLCTNRGPQCLPTPPTCLYGCNLVSTPLHGDSVCPHDPAGPGQSHSLSRTFLVHFRPVSTCAGTWGTRYCGRRTTKLFGRLNLVRIWPPSLMQLSPLFFPASSNTYEPSHYKKNCKFEALCRFYTNLNGRLTDHRH